METICSSHSPLYRDLPLYEVHQIRRAATGEPTLLEKGRFVECSQALTRPNFFLLLILLFPQAGFISSFAIPFFIIVIS